MKKKTIRDAKTFDELLEIKYCKMGTSKRDKFEEKAQYFVIREMLKEARKEAHMTQDELAEKVGIKKVISQDLKTVSATFNFQRFTEYLSSVLVDQ
jgi:ribosome-binding protein aMBF1 (putative translation factor)